MNPDLPGGALNGHQEAQQSAVSLEFIKYFDEYIEDIVTIGVRTSILPS